MTHPATIESTLLLSCAKLSLIELDKILHEANKKGLRCSAITNARGSTVSLSATTIMAEFGGLPDDDSDDWPEEYDARPIVTDVTPSVTRDIGRLLNISAGSSPGDKVLLDLDGSHMEFTIVSVNARPMPDLPKWPRSVRGSAAASDEQWYEWWLKMLDSFGRAMHQSIQM